MIEEERSMRTLMQPIATIAWSDATGKLTPMRFQVETKDSELITIQVEKVLNRSEQKRAGQRSLHFLCRSTIDAAMRQFELCFELSSCRWYLSKW